MGFRGSDPAQRRTSTKGAPNQSYDSSKSASTGAKARSGRRKRHERGKRAKRLSAIRRTVLGFLGQQDTGLEDGQASDHQYKCFVPLRCVQRDDVQDGRIQSRFPWFRIFGENCRAAIHVVLPSQAGGWRVERRSRSFVGHREYQIRTSGGPSAQKPPKMGKKLRGPRQGGRSRVQKSPPIFDSFLRVLLPQVEVAEVDADKVSPGTLDKPGEKKRSKLTTNLGARYLNMGAMKSRLNGGLRALGVGSVDRLGVGKLSAGRDYIDNLRRGSGFPDSSTLEGSGFGRGSFQDVIGEYVTDVRACQGATGDTQHGVYSLKDRGKPRKLKLEHLALPSAVRETVRVERWVPSEWMEWLEQPDVLFNGSAEECGKQRRPCFMVDEDDYPPILKRFEELGIVGLGPEKPKYVNGYFGVAKNKESDPKTRVITDCATTNSHTRPLPKVHLPNPSDLSLLPPWVTKSVSTDLESYYHCLRLPEGWSPYFGLPSVAGHLVGRPDLKVVHPTCKTMPMGWTGSVNLGQVIHERVIEEWIASDDVKELGLTFVNLKDKEAVLKSFSLDHDKVIYYLVYVDDFSMYGLTGATLDMLLKMALKWYAGHGFKTKDSKTVFSTSVQRILGIVVDLEQKELRPTAEARSYLHHTLPLMCRSKNVWSAGQLQHIMGKIIWVALLKRPLLSIFSSTFVFIEKLVKSGGKEKLWPSVRAELDCFWSLLPLVRTKLVDLGASTLCSDATGVDKHGKSGIGVVYAETGLNLEYFLEGWSESYSAKFVELDWKWAMSYYRESSSHVNLQEMTSVLASLQVAARNELASPAERLVMFNDNQACVGAVKKGRSRSWNLNCLIRRYAGFLLVLDWPVPVMPYISTYINPADAPSRYRPGV